MVPAQAHEHVEVLARALTSSMAAIFAPGVHGPETTGTHGIGVSTPIAAAVAEATCGFDWLWHIPNGAMFTMGFMSMTVATGCSCPLAVHAGRTVSVEGAMPWLHLSFAPLTTSFVICRS